MKTLLWMAMLMFCHHLVMGMGQNCSDDRLFGDMVSNLENDLLYGYPNMKALNTSIVGVFWDHLVPGILMDCLVCVELIDSDRRILGMEDKKNKLKTKEALFQNLDICKENEKKMKIKFTFQNANNLNRTATSKEVQYQVPKKHFYKNKMPPYCASETAMTIAIFGNVFKPIFFGNCFLKVRVCPFGKDEKDCQELKYGDKENRVVFPGQFDGQKVSLRYYETESAWYPVTLNIEHGHCDPFFTEDPDIEYTQNIEESIDFGTVAVPLSLGIALMISMAINCYQCVMIGKKTTEVDEEIAMATGIEGKNVQYENEKYDHYYDRM
eukprot:GFUD01087997.1.p1 GENE.GFUD01087997.1~~GFUD01087997.1.p1  ORF type:complete len:324 (+),score=67.54 GFUD01087997.1:181-1152(+)